MSRSPVTFTGVGIGILAALVIPAGLGTLISTKAFENWLSNQPGWLAATTVIGYWFGVLICPVFMYKYVSRLVNTTIAQRLGQNAGRTSSTVAVVGWIVLAVAVIAVVAMAVAIYLAIIAFAIVIGALVLIGFSAN